MMVCARLQIREPIEFHALSPAAQDMWLQFELDMWTGAFQSSSNRPRGNGEAGARAAEAAFIAAQKAKAGVQ